MPCMSRTSYPSTACAAVLSAMGGLTSEFGMGSGDPSLHGSAHAGQSLRAAPGRMPGPAGHPQGCMRTLREDGFAKVSPRNRGKTTPSVGEGKSSAY